jgi:hypothetical protein
VDLTSIPQSGDQEVFSRRRLHVAQLIPLQAVEGALFQDPDPGSQDLTHFRQYIVAGRLADGDGADTPCL